MRKIICLQCVPHCATVRGMKKPDSNITETGTIRLANGHIQKLREVMRAKGREWFEKWVRKEHEKLSKKND